jgi:hypothetical protein
MDRRRLFAAGALLGAATCVEYHAAVVAAVLTVHVCVNTGRRVGWLFAGASPFVVALGVYHWRAFGAPWRLPFGYFAGTINGTSEGGYTIPGFEGLTEVLAGPHGLLWNAPLVLLAAGAAIWLARSPEREIRTHALVGLAILVPLFVLVAGWSGTPTLETPGPRYLAPALPFLAVPLAAVWPRISRAAVLAAALGLVVALAAAFGAINTPASHIPLLDYLGTPKRDLAPTIWSLAIGPFGIALYVAMVGAAVAYLVQVSRSVPAGHGVDARERVGARP